MVGTKNVMQTGEMASPPLEGEKPRSAGKRGVRKRYVKVSCRFKPALQVKDLGYRTSPAAKEVVIVGVPEHNANGHRCPAQSFHFDKVFKGDASQEDIYESVAKPLVKDMLEGFSTCILAYGQTGSGKTHTMMGAYRNADNGSKVPDMSVEEQPGLIPRVARDLFQSISEAGPEMEAGVKVSYLEIYQEQIHDLLVREQGASLRLREHPVRGFYVEDLAECYVCSSEELLTFVAAGNARRAIASTRMNEFSSRSHAVVKVTIDLHDISNGLKKSGCMYLVDLAGSELVKRSEARGVSLSEAKSINRSLSALGNVIKALAEGASHVPYRDSKLTKLLQETMGGDSETALIITVSPSVADATESVSTLRFGTRARCVRNTPTVHQEVTSHYYEQLLAEAAARESHLRQTLEALERAAVREVPAVTQETAGDDGSDGDALVAGPRASDHSVCSAKYSKLLAELEDTLWKLDATMSAKDFLGEELEEREQQANSLQSDIEALTIAAAAARAAFAKEQGQVTALEGHVSDLQCRLAKLEQESATWQEQKKLAADAFRTTSSKDVSLDARVAGIRLLSKFFGSGHVSPSSNKAEGASNTPKEASKSREVNCKPRPSESNKPKSTSQLEQPGLGREGKGSKEHGRGALRAVAAPRQLPPPRPVVKPAIRELWERQRSFDDSDSDTDSDADSDTDSDGDVVELQGPVVELQALRALVESASRRGALSESETWLALARIEEVEEGVAVTRTRRLEGRVVSLEDRLEMANESLREITSKQQAREHALQAEVKMHRAIIKSLKESLAAAGAPSHPNGHTNGVTTGGVRGHGHGPTMVKKVRGGGKSSTLDERDMGAPKHVGWRYDDDHASQVMPLPPQPVELSPPMAPMLDGEGGGAAAEEAATAGVAAEGSARIKYKAPARIRYSPSA
ncbi:unnamed protein product [Chrysoparadoxa australica]